ncbi:unnamed protein product, partial [Ectocarpus sp. 12 AP-2014]
GPDRRNHSEIRQGSPQQTLLEVIVSHLQGDPRSGVRCDSGGVSWEGARGWVRKKSHDWMLGCLWFVQMIPCPHKGIAERRLVGCTTRLHQERCKSIMWKHPSQHALGYHRRPFLLRQIS